MRPYWILANHSDVRTYTWSVALGGRFILIPMAMI